MTIWILFEFTFLMILQNVKKIFIFRNLSNQALTNIFFYKAIILITRKSQILTTGRGWCLDMKSTAPLPSGFSNINGFWGTLSQTAWPGQTTQNWQPHHQDQLIYQNCSEALHASFLRMNGRTLGQLNQTSISYLELLLVHTIFGLIYVKSIILDRP